MKGRKKTQAGSIVKIGLEKMEKKTIKIKIEGLL
jgi:ribosomal protein S7